MELEKKMVRLLYLVEVLIPTMKVSAAERIANRVVAVVASVGVGVVVVVAAVDAGVDNAAGMLLSYGGTAAS